ncbi:MAG: ATP-dependent RNA helicase HrpA, partial [Chromatiales bacterium]|nr:ATP-dependent RNA helicase HrpA [Chromatiales bacterium]
EARIARLPRPTIPSELPIAAAVADIESAVARGAVTVVCGATGSGKTTQLPKILLGLGLGGAGLIGHTQPRRIAARAVAERIAQELGSRPGATVGYQVRFDRQVGEDSLVKVMTDGILLAEIQADPELSAYDAIIVDEAHERSLNIDFLLGYLRRLVERRRDLKVILSSATIDAERFSAFFDGAPVVEVSGRSYPVEVRYRPFDPELSDLPGAVAETVADLCAEGPGDVLAFLATEREIRETADALRASGPRGLEVLPLFARLPVSEQARIFTPHTGRRVVLATNIAETSLTVPGIRYVVDAGLARISRHSHRSTVQRLPVEPIARAAADQRAGRCGRVGPGVCVRLYTEEDYLTRPAFPEPEIQRCDLASVLLTMRALGIHGLEDFPFLDAPDRRFVNDGLRLLTELGALDADERLTDLGRQLARLPLDPRVGRMLVAAAEEECLSDMLVVAAGLAVPDPRERPPGKEAHADLAHRRHADERSDFNTMLALWDAFREQARSSRRRELEAWCRRGFLSARRLREWQDVHEQLAGLAREAGLHIGARGAPYARLHRALVAGLLRNVGFRVGEREYSGVRDLTFRIGPGSGLYGKAAKWVVAAEIVETTQPYAHRVANIRPEWVEKAAGDLLRRGHFGAHWDAARAEPMVYEQTALHGLTLVPRRRVRFAGVSRPDAREMFLRSALVEGRYAGGGRSLAWNRGLVASLREYDQKLRRPDVLVDDDAVHAFYDRVVPEDVLDGATFEAWRRRAEREDPGCLEMTETAVRRREPDAAWAEAFPDRIAVGGADIGLEYRFSPGEPDDGITAVVELSLVRELEPEPFEWLVPGRLEERVLAMLRALPKSTRRELVPLPETAAGFVARRYTPAGSLASALAEHLRTVHGVSVPSAPWRPEILPAELPDHLCMNFRVVDSDGEVRAQGRDLLRLQRELGAIAGAPARALPVTAVGTRATRWVFGAIPEAVGVVRDGRPAEEYPALVDRGDAVELVRMATPDAAAQASRAGVLRLVMLQMARDTARHRRDVAHDDRLCLLYALAPPAPGLLAAASMRPGPPGGAGAELAADLVDAALRLAVGDATAVVRDADAFEHLLARARANLDAGVEEVRALVREILTIHHQVRSAHGAPELRAPAESLADIDEQLVHLVHRGFLGTVPLAALRDYPRYLRAIETRLTRLGAGGARDGSRLEHVRPLWERYLVRARGHRERGKRDGELERYRWMVEELRVSVFAQELGTAEPISRQRLDAQWSRVAS